MSKRGVESMNTRNALATDTTAWAAPLRRKTASLTRLLRLTFGAGITASGLIILAVDLNLPGVGLLCSLMSLTGYGTR
jgi:hypothetical protein